MNSMDKRFWIIVGILALVGLGFMFMSTITGNVITGSVVAPMRIDNEYYRISDFGEDVEGGNDDGKSRSG